MRMVVYSSPRRALDARALMSCRKRIFEGLVDNSISIGDVRIPRCVALAGIRMIRNAVVTSSFKAVEIILMTLYTNPAQFRHKELIDSTVCSLNG